MSDINISSEKIINAHRYLTLFYRNFPQINEVNIPSTVADKLDMSDYKSKLAQAKEALNYSAVDSNALGITKQSLENIIQILSNSTPEIGILYETSMNDLNNFYNMQILNKNASINIREFDIEVKQNYSGGILYQLKNKGVISYSLYIPNKINEKTTVGVYFRGARDPNEKEPIQSKGCGLTGAMKYLDKNPNQIFFFVDNCDSKKVVEGINTVISDLGIKKKRISVFGFSVGTKTAMEFANSYTNGIDSIVLFDPAANGQHLPSYGNTVDNIKKSGAKLYIISTQKTLVNSNIVSLASKLDTYFIKTKSENGHSVHTTISNEAVENGAFDVFGGQGGSLKTTSYDDFFKYNSTDKKWNSLGLNNIPNNN